MPTSRAAVWAWAVVLLGCATVPGPRGPAARYQQQAGVPAEGGDTLGLPLAEDAAPEPRRWPLRYRHPERRWGTDLTWADAPEPEEGQRERGAEGARAPEGWPDLDSSDEELLAPFLACRTPLEFLQLQQRVDMARLVEKLDDWSAVRLGALGPVGKDASEALTRKRAAFILYAEEDYGAAHAQVFTLFILHSAFDDEVSQLLRLLAAHKQLGQTLGRMEAVRQELESRGLRLEDVPDRQEQAGDMVRGLGRAAREALATSDISRGARMLNMTAQLRQLPPAYQQALHAVGAEQFRQHLSPGNVAVGSFDALTFGVPMGFYHLAAGTKHGVEVLGQGQYEQAVRELAPAALVVTLYVGGKAGRMVGGGGVGAPGRWAVPEARLEALRGVAQRLGERLGLEGINELSLYIRARREAGVLVAAEGELGALALLQKLNAALDTPPPGVPEGYALWGEYVAYRRNRLAELEQGRPAQGPLRWEGYERMRGMFARGLAFERAMVSRLRADAALPQAQRAWLKAFIQPRIEVHVGVSKPGVPGIRFADVLILEEQPLAGQPPRVETFSFKSRNLRPLDNDALEELMRADARAALNYYGGTLDILRPSLRRRVQVQRVRLVYESSELIQPNQDVLRGTVKKVNADVKGVEVLFQ